MAAWRRCRRPSPPPLYIQTLQRHFFGGRECFFQKKKKIVPKKQKILFSSCHLHPRNFFSSEKICTFFCFFRHQQISSSRDFPPATNRQQCAPIVHTQKKCQRRRQKKNPALPASIFLEVSCCRRQMASTTPHTPIFTKKKKFKK